ncbi:hypothetical protein GJ699_02405 [Duganella sp. FT80W]|uniref:Uncharacterized protein n=1 Tax=Duganella guangzhouensis TaxID=2666084 RepID=A0A6I2KTU2_9BURK|nr:hypothetical protein [Duganella guangzhouensis]MRW88832.1 hypothetical protein [Duganella guangzhouensis]
MPIRNRIDALIARFGYVRAPAIAGGIASTSVRIMTAAVPNSANRPWFADLVRRNIAMRRARQIEAIIFRLKVGFYSFSRAVCANVYRGLTSIQSGLLAIRQATTSGAMRFVILQVRVPPFLLAQFFFELAFAIGQRKLLLLKRQALILDVDHSVVHVADHLID